MHSPSSCISGNSAKTTDVANNWAHACTLVIPHSMDNTLPVRTIRWWRRVTPSSCAVRAPRCPAEPSTFAPVKPTGSGCHAPPGWPGPFRAAPRASSLPARRGCRQCVLGEREKRRRVRTAAAADLHSLCTGRQERKESGADPPLSIRNPNPGVRARVRVRVRVGVMTGAKSLGSAQASRHLR
eukprot:7378227-Prymnesium_polylepis.1